MIHIPGALRLRRLDVMVVTPIKIKRPLDVDEFHRVIGSVRIPAERCACGTAVASEAAVAAAAQRYSVALAMLPASDVPA